VQFLQRPHQLRRHWNFAFLVSLQCPAAIWFVRHPHHAVRELDVFLADVHHFLRPHPGHQEELKPKPFPFVTAGEELLQFFLVVNLWL